MLERTLETNELIRECLLEYGSHIIEDRALADVRDGLKPSQRRILWALHQMGRGSKAIPIKCASVVGTVIAQYHPHGDQACYDTLVNLYWQRYPLVDKEGNFGNHNSLIDSGYAAQRYTETRLSEFAERILDDVEIVPLIKSFTEEHDEPPVLLARVPLLLINGCSGVAMGISTCIPPHNLHEIVDAVIYLLDNPDCTVKELLKLVKGPDYGSGILTANKEDLLSLYETGQGKLQFSCEYSIEEGVKGSKRLVITGMSPGFRKNRFVEATKTLADQKLLVAPANDDGSQKSGTRITVEFTDAKIIKDRILPLLKTSVGYQFYTLAGPNRQPQLLGLKPLLQKFIEFRRKVEAAVLQNELRKVTEKDLAERAKLIAMDNLKAVLAILELAETADDAITLLKSKLSITDSQAEVILGLQLRTLMRKTNRADLVAKLEGYQKKMREIQQDLLQIDVVVKRRLLEMSRYFDKRGTRLRGGDQDIEDFGEALYYVGVTAQAKIDSTDQVPTKSKAAWSYVGLVTTPGRFVVVSDDNVGQLVSLSYLDKFDTKIGPVVGVASEQHSIVVAVSRLGQYVAFDTDQRRQHFPVFRDIQGDHLVAAVGINSGDQVACWFSDGTVEVLRDLKATRPNVAAKSIKKRTRTPHEVVALLPLRQDETLLDTTGAEVGSGDLSSYKADALVVAGATNLLVLEDGRRMVKSLDETIDLLGQGTVKTVVPIQVPTGENAAP